MTRRTFIRGIWGVTSDGVPSPGLENKVWLDIATTLRNYHPVKPCINYVFGRNNAVAMEQAGAPYTLLSEEPLVNWENAPGERDTVEGDCRGRLAWGLSLWRHKMECIRKALETHNEAVWLDWDTHLLRPLPSDFWQRLGKGQPFQSQLRRYSFPQCLWRARRKDRKIVPHGAFIYCRSAAFIEQAIRVHSAHYRHLTDEIAFAHVIELMMKGWSVENYYRMGFAPYCYTTRQAVRDPEERIFVEGLLRKERHILKDAQPNADAERIKIRPRRDIYLNGIKHRAGKSIRLSATTAKLLISKRLAAPVRPRL